MDSLNRVTSNESLLDIQSDGVTIVESIRESPKVNDLKKTMIAELKTIFREWSVLRSIHLNPVPVIIHRLYHFCTLISYGCVIPFFWCWLGFTVGTIVLGITILFLTLVLDITKRIASVYDPISWAHKRKCIETTEKHIYDLHKILGIQRGDGQFRDVLIE
jgi:hypothetical protein